MRKNIFVIGLIALVVLAVNNGAGQTRQSQPVAAPTPSEVKQFWTDNATVDIGDKASETLIDILVTVLLYDEVVDKIVSLKTSTGSALSAEQLAKLRKWDDRLLLEIRLEAILAECPAGRTKSEAETALSFWKQAVHVIDDVKNDLIAIRARASSDTLSLQLAALNKVELVDMIRSYKRRMGMPLSEEAEKDLLKKSLDLIFILHNGAQREYLAWSRSKYGNPSKSPLQNKP